MQRHATHPPQYERLLVVYGCSCATPVPPRVQSAWGSVPPVYPSVPTQETSLQEGFLRHIHARRMSILSGLKTRFPSEEAKCYARRPFESGEENKERPRLMNAPPMLPKHRFAGIKRARTGTRRDSAPPQLGDGFADALLCVSAVGRWRGSFSNSTSS